LATVKLTTDNFDQMVKSNEMLLVDFWAEWCGPCRTFAPTFESISEKYPSIVFGKVNTEEERDLAMQYQIRSIPTLMILREQIIIFRQAGALPAKALEEIIEKARSLDMDMVREEIAKQQQANA
jgi:thioredoxin 1